MYSRKAISLLKRTRLSSAREHCVPESVSAVAAALGGFAVMAQSKQIVWAVPSEVYGMAACCKQVINPEKSHCPTTVQQGWSLATHAASPGHASATRVMH